MRPNWMRAASRWCVGVSSGGITFGFLQALDLISLAEVFTSFLSTWLSALVTLLFGGDASAFV